MASGWESRFLRCALRDPSEKTYLPDIQKLLIRELDWHCIVETANAHKVCSILYRNLQSIPVDRIPFEINERLQRMSRAVALQNLRIYEELNRILHVLGDSNIPTIVLKGAALAEGFWRNLSLRQMDDIDILVPEILLDQADHLLRAIGYVRNERYRPAEWYKKHHHHLAPLYNSRNGICVEVHRSLVPLEAPFRVNVERVWERSRDFLLGGASCKVLSPEDMVVHLCLESSYCDSLFRRVRTILDIWQIIETVGMEMDWTLVKEEAKEGNYAHLIYYPLTVAKDLFRAEIPKKDLAYLKRANKSIAHHDYLIRILARKMVLVDDKWKDLFPPWRLKLFFGTLIGGETLFSALRKAVMSIPSGGSERPADRPQGDDRASRISFKTFPRFFILVSKFLRVLALKLFETTTGRAPKKSVEL